MNKINLPAPLRGAELGSFAHDTMARRLPGIVRRVLAENVLSDAAAAAVEALANELPYTPIRPLQDPDAPDVAAWARYVAPYVGMNWLDVPWFFAETYLFRRVIAATGYFSSQPGRGLDPYAQQKFASLELSQQRLATLVVQDQLPLLIQQALWGNQADLSLWPVEQGGRPAGGAPPQTQQLLTDDSLALANHIIGLARQGARVDIVLDNAGFELLCDLALVDQLLASNLHVVLHGKPHPTYVSDVTAADLATTIQWLRSRADVRMAALGNRLATALAAEQLRLVTDWFWTSPLAGWELPEGLRTDLAGSGLIISKGDANYRRWLGDRHWAYDTPLERILAYVPAPLALLRTCKSNVLAGIAPERQAAAFAQEQDWLTNGRWGVAQFIQL